MTTTPDDLEKYGVGIILLTFFIWLLYTTIKDKRAADKEDRKNMIEAKKIADKEDRQNTIDRISKLEDEYDQLKEEARKDREYIKNELIEIIKSNGAKTEDHAKAYREQAKEFKVLCQHIGKINKAV